MADQTTNRDTVEMAFALGGLSGHNFHGAGFLQAALDTERVDEKFVPNMISCTSGQIYWVYNYLLARRGALEDEHPGIRDLKGLAEKNPWLLPHPGFATDYVANLFTVTGDSWRKLSSQKLLSVASNPLPYVIDSMMNSIPAKILKPAFSPEDCEKMADRFNNELDIGILFNSYDPKEGTEYVYINDQAAKLRDRKKPQPSTYRVTKYHRTEYWPITADAVKNALWIAEYGLDDQAFLDGAYYRMVMLGELSRARTIYVARPVRFKWEGDMPVQYGNMEVLKSEMTDNGSYFGERFQIELMNRLLKQDELTQEAKDKKGYHRVEIREVPIRVQWGLEGYVKEHIGIFNQAREEAKRIFA